MNALTPAWYNHGGKDPTSLTWPPQLPLEMALKTASLEELRLEYGYSREAWASLPLNPIFVKDLTEACELVRQEGMSYRVKARMLAEDFLPNVYKMVNAQGEVVPPSVKADLIKFVTRVAGYDQKAVEGAGVVAANALSITLNLGEGY